MALRCLQNADEVEEEQEEVEYGSFLFMQSLRSCCKSRPPSSLPPLPPPFHTHQPRVQKGGGGPCMPEPRVSPSSKKPEYSMK